ncbi:MAG: hypothetical protein ACOY45_10535 [Pseudomonadota bacterium]
MSPSTIFATLCGAGALILWFGILFARRRAGSDRAAMIGSAVGLSLLALLFPRLSLPLAESMVVLGGGAVQLGVGVAAWARGRGTWRA